MHDFLKFVFYLNVAFQFFYAVFALLFPGMLISYLSSNDTFVARVKELKDAGQDPNEDPELKSKTFKMGCFAFLLVALVIHFYAILVLGFFTLNWYVFVVYLVYMLVKVAIRKKTKAKPTVTGTVIGSIVSVVFLGYALINAYQLHLTFSDVTRHLGF